MKTALSSLKYGIAVAIALALVALVQSAMP